MLKARQAALAAVILTGFAPFAAALADHAHHSPAKTVLAALKGATVEGEDRDGKTYLIKYLADGSATRTVNGVAEPGAWSVDAGGHYCETWKQAYEGKKRCAGIEVTGSLLIIRGKIKTTRTVVEVPAKAN